MPIRAVDLAIASLLVAGCADDDAASPCRPGQPSCVGMVLDLDGSDVDDPVAGFYRMGFPTDLRASADGWLDLSSFPGREEALTGRYLRVIEEDVRGFATIQALYLLLSGPVDPGRLPADPAA